jgi:hypothetical protein
MKISSARSMLAVVAMWGSASGACVPEEVDAGTDAAAA